MDLVQNGESSRSPSSRAAQNADQANGSGIKHVDAGTRASRLIMPVWDVAPPKHVHASHDLFSLLSLQSHHDNYLRPYIHPALDEEDWILGSGKKRKLEIERPPLRKHDKGYQGLLSDCIDPIPLPPPNNTDSGKQAFHDILPLISDIHSNDPLGRVMPDVWDQPIEMLRPGAFGVATLEAGQTQQGYKDGRKMSVVEAQERKERKRLRQLRLQSQASIASPIPTPTLAPSASSPVTTPLLPVAPPSRTGPQGTFANMQAHAQASNQNKTGGIRLSIPKYAASSPANASSPLVNAHKRPNPDGMPAEKQKKAKTAGTRSASPMPTQAAAGSGGLLGQQGQAKPYGKGPRARTDEYD